MSIPVTAEIAGPRLWTPEFEITRRPDGCILMQQTGRLPPFARAMPDSLTRWAAETPDAVWLMQRDADNSWRKVRFGQALAIVRALASGLLELGLGPDRPLLILSDNSIDHGLLGTAAQYAGIPYAPLSPAYSLVSKDHSKLKDIAELLKPGLLYASDGDSYGPALAAIAAPGRAVLVSRNPAQGATLWSDLAATGPSAAAEAAFAGLTGATVAKYLFTSGSTGAPKAVINSQAMMTGNMAMVTDCFRFLTDHPPVFVDWAPWSHTASGNKVFNMALTHGGTYVVDDGRPTPGLIQRSIANITETPPTWYFNVPLGYEMLVREMEARPAFRDAFFSRLDLAMYAGAGMAQHTWEALRRLSHQAIGREALLVTGLGATETGPFAIMNTTHQPKPGNVGIPAKGVTLKLVPNQDKLEVRLKSPSITPGYYGDPALSAAALDEEGFYMLGDALRPADPEDFSKGFLFDGRVAENFKLSTGTWVAVGALRARLVDALGGLVRDAVILGEGEAEVAAILVPDAAELAKLGAEGDLPAQLASAPVLKALLERLAAFAKVATGSATRVRRAVVLVEPLSLDRGEVTDKGSVNQRAVIRNRPDLAKAVYGDGPEVLRV